MKLSARTFLRIAIIIISFADEYISYSAISTYQEDIRRAFVACV